MIVLNCNDLGISFGANDILRHITFALGEGERLGVVGVNGAGKSTLLKILCGQAQMTEGSVFLKKGATISMLSQNESVDSAKTPYEELLDSRRELVECEEKLEALVARLEKGDTDAEKAYHDLHDRFLDMGGYGYRGRIKGLLRSLGVDENSEIPCAKLSGGQRTRLALAKVLYAEPDVLLLDEPTNHLDAASLVFLEEHLRSYRKTVVVVSHDRYFLDRVATKILDIEYGTAKLYDGNYTQFVQKKRTDKEIEERHYKNQQREIARIEAYIAQQKQWNRERNIIAAESRQKALDRMEKLDKPKDAPKSIRLSFKAGLESGNDVLSVRDLGISFGEKKVFEGLSFDVYKGDRLFVIGHNGCGKSSLMKILTGRYEQDKGRYSFGYNLTPGYYDQDNQELRSENTVYDELTAADPSQKIVNVYSALALFRFFGDDVFKKVSVLSGGERARLTFAKLILRDHNLLLLDEPTNHLDIPSKEALEEALRSYDGTLIVVSHDRYFIDKLSTKILDFDGPDGKPLFFDGNYREYQNYRALCGDTAKETAEKAPASENKEQYLQSKKNRSELNRLRGAHDRAEKERIEIEAELDALKKKEEEHQTDYQILSQISQRREELEERLLALYEIIEETEKELSSRSE